MSTIKLKTTSNGSVTLSPQDTASDVVLTVPAGTSTVVTNATLPAQLNASGSAPIYACRAWVNFNGTGTVAIRASGNVTSITDNGTGKYTINFATQMPDENYSTVVSSSSGDGGQTWLLSDVGPNLNSGGFSASHTTTSSIKILGGSSSSSLPYDTAVTSVAIFR